MTIRLNALAAIALACLSCAAPAGAQERMKVTARVRIADLDLATAAGRATLKARIHNAALANCVSQVAAPAGPADEARCRREMEQDGDAQIAARMNDAVQVATAR
jgi:UrcA family protein